MPQLSYQDINAATIDAWVAEGWEWGRPIDHEAYLRATEGDWDVLLTPTKPVPHSWFPALKGADVLGLACGGGQQMPILTAAGARCTVLDYSLAQLESDRMVAEREGIDLTIVRADMTKPLPFDDNSFDLVFNPVSLCYIREVEPIWHEVRRVLRPAGVLLTGWDTGLNYVVDEAEERIVRGLPYDPVADPNLLTEAEREEYGVQFSHTLDDLLGSLLHAGFCLDDLYEDVNGEGRLSELGIPTMLAVRAHAR
jgi:SAM-dependent methyltransferase